LIGTLMPAVAFAERSTALPRIIEEKVVPTALGGSVTRTKRMFAASAPAAVFET
jgi:hypothetical protein